jgi:hypothetical protein
MLSVSEVLGGVIGAIIQRRASGGRRLVVAASLRGMQRVVLAH